MGEDRLYGFTKLVISNVYNVLDLAAIASGAYLGFHYVQGIPIDDEMVKNALIYAPTVVRGIYVGAMGGIIGSIVGGENADESWSNKLLGTFSNKL